MGAYAKNILRTIWGNKRRSLMLMLITALGAALFIGIRSAPPDMRFTFNSYYERQAMYDIQVVSTYGLTDSNVAELRRVHGVQRAEPAYSSDLFAQIGDASYLIRIHSGAPPGLENDMPARPVVIAGRMPEQPGECALSWRFAEMRGCRVGERLTLSTGDDTPLDDFVSQEAYMITGLVESPLYIRDDLGTSKKGSGSLDGYAYIPFDSFTLPVYSEAQIFLSNPQGYSRFDQRFQDMSAAAEEELQQVGDEVAAHRRRVVRERTVRDISGAAESLEAARAALSQSESEMSASEWAFVESEQELLRQRTALYEQALSGRRGMEAGNAELIAARLAIDRGKLALAEGRKALAGMRSLQGAGSGAGGYAGGGEASETAGAGGLARAAAEDPPGLTGSYAGAAAGLSGWGGMAEPAGTGGSYGVEGDASAGASGDAQWQFILAEAELNAKARELSLAEAEWEGKQAELLSNMGRLDAAWYDGLAKLSVAEAEMSAARDALDDGRARFAAEKAAAEARIAASEAGLSAARRALRAMPEAKCYILGLDLNANFESFRQDSDRVESIGRVFPLFFFLVAALVAFTCMVRIVEDDRATAAVMQSLGYSSRQVFMKYIAYALSIGIPGTILGIAVGYRLFPTVIFDYGYRIMYILPPVEKLLYPSLCLMVCAISLISVTVPAVLISAAGISQVPASLMRPKAPPPGKRIFLESIGLLWARMNFSAKVTARNILRYKKRFFMTIAGISGCMAILITGFGLRDSIRMVAVKQFDDIYQYDVLITVAEGGADRASLERLLMSLGEIEGWQYQRRENADVRIGRTGTAYETTLVVPDEAGLLGDFVTLKERRTGRPVLPSDNGVVITQKLALLLGASVGDEITMINEDDEEWAAAVVGVAENYVGHYVYMTPAYYAGITGARLKYTTIVGKTRDMGEARREEISESLLENNGVVALSFNAKVRDFYTDLLDALNIVVFVLIACGALLSFVVLTCLTGVNIDERKREIATLKVLGFYDGEAASYIFRENMVNTVVGSAAGMGLGVLLHQYIIRTVELDMIVFGKVVSPLSFAYATALTFLFTFAVNLAMSGDIRNIDMIESLKSVE